MSIEKGLKNTQHKSSKVLMTKQIYDTFTTLQNSYNEFFLSSEKMFPELNDA